MEVTSSARPCWASGPDLLISTNKLKSLHNKIASFHINKKDGKRKEKAVCLLAVFATVTQQDQLNHSCVSELIWIKHLGTGVFI